MSNIDFIMFCGILMRMTGVLTHRSIAQLICCNMQFTGVAMQKILYFGENFKVYKEPDSFVNNKHFFVTEFPLEMLVSVESLICKSAT